MLRRLTSTSSTWMTMPLRLALGAIFLGHGAQKVLGSFNGPGWNKWLSFSQFAPFPFMRPAWLWLAAAALGELVGGALVLLGLLTRVGAFLIVCSMLVAIIGIHWPAFFAPCRDGVGGGVSGECTRAVDWRRRPGIDRSNAQRTTVDALTWSATSVARRRFG